MLTSFGTMVLLEPWPEQYILIKILEMMGAKRIVKSCRWFTDDAGT